MMTVPAIKRRKDEAEDDKQRRIKLMVPEIARDFFSHEDW